MNKQERIRKAVANLREEGFGVSRKITKSTPFTMMMSQDVTTNGKDVRLITLKDGSHALLIDGVRYNFEIMLYTQKDVNKTVNEAGLMLFNYNAGRIEF